MDECAIKVGAKVYWAPLLRGGGTLRRDEKAMSRRRATEHAAGPAGHHAGLLVESQLREAATLAAAAFAESPVYRYMSPGDADARRAFLA